MDSQSVLFSALVGQGGCPPVVSTWLLSGFTSRPPSCLTTEDTTYSASVRLMFVATFNSCCGIHFCPSTWPIHVSLCHSCFVQCVLYFRMKDSTARAMEHLESASEGVRLWVTYCQRVGIDDDFHGRFKVKHHHACSASRFFSTSRF